MEPSIPAHDRSIDEGAVPAAEQGANSMLNPRDVGHRVVVRRVVGTRDGRPLYSDALGELVELTETHATVRTAAGPVRVPTNGIVRAKRVPDRRRLSATEALESVAAAGWPAPDTDRLGDWLLRAASGWTGRGNTALPVGDPGRPLPEAIDAVERWYAARDLPSGFSVPLPLRAGLDAELATRGYRVVKPTLVQTGPLAAVVSDAPGVRLDTEPPPSWLAVVAGRKGQLPDAARHILTSVVQVRFAGVYSADSAALAIGRGVVTDGWLGLSLIEVVPELRRRGLARQVMGALGGWAAQLGADRVYLQVEEVNQPAIALYERMGLRTHHRYQCRILD
jgi:GNAT superfamily N-acetyltransferase